MRLDHLVAATNNPLHLWTEHSKEQLNWAFRGYKRFVDSLSEEVRERLQQRDHKQEAYVVVFGKTQVGKTTLIMDLMGVSEEAMNRVSAVLRGGRPAGKSATATVMEYKRSVDKFWHLKIGDRECTQLNDDEMTSELGKLREDMEAQRLNINSPCVVTIPKDCFIMQSYKEATVRMLDLPGDSPANPVERFHVHAMAKKYVPMADLILLVGRGDDLSFLQPDNLHLPGIEDWQSVPSRFRIITTYSFTPQSVRDYVLQYSKEISEKNFQERLIQEIEKFGELSQYANKLELYFPLEFGKSWSAAKNAKDGTEKIYDKVSPLLKKLKEKLHADIQSSTTDIARLRNAVDAHVTIAHIKKEKSDRLKKAIDILEKKHERYIGEYKQAQSIIDEKKKEYSKLKSRLKNLTSQQLQEDIDNGLKIGNINSGDPDETVLGFRSCINTAKSSLKQEIKLIKPKYNESSNWFWRNVQINWQENLMNDIFNEKFSQFLSILNNYSLTDYYPSISNDYKNDKEQLKNCIQSAAKSITEAVRKWWLDAALECRNNFEKQLSNMDVELKRLKDIQNNIWYSIEKKKAEIEISQLECEAFKKQMDNDLEESKRFTEILDDEYVKELERKRNALAKGTNYTHFFLLLLAAVQLQDVRQKLLHTIKES